MLGAAPLPTAPPPPFPPPCRSVLHCRVTISDQLQLLISDICSRLDVDGLRGDLVVNRAAKALVALEGRAKVEEADVERVITSCLNHRWGGRGLCGKRRKGML